MLIVMLSLGLSTPVQDPPPAPPPVIRIDPQIQTWLDRSPARDADADRGPIWDDDRVHGEVAVSVGTGGLRAYGGVIDVPIGRGGRLSLGYHESENDVWRGPHSRYPRVHPEMLGADDRPLAR